MYFYCHIWRTVYSCDLLNSSIVQHIYHNGNTLMYININCLISVCLNLILETCQDIFFFIMHRFRTTCNKSFLSSVLDCMLSDPYTCRPTDWMCHSILSKWTIYSHSPTISRCWLGKWFWAPLVERWGLSCWNFVKENTTH